MLALRARPQTSVAVIMGADDSSMNLWKPNAFRDTRESLFIKQKGLTGMRGCEVERRNQVLRLKMAQCYHRGSWALQ